MGNRIVTRRAGARLLLLALTALVVVLALAVAAPAALGFGSYIHDGITPVTGCASCHTVNTDTPPTNAACTASTCHAGFMVYTGSTETCWTCHTPGQDMTTAKTNAGCAAAGCHATKPHFGADPAACTTCHSVSVSAADPDGSPHHDAVNFITKTKVTLALTGLRSGAIKYGKSVVAKGTVKPVRAGKVLVTIQRKVGTKWVKAVAKARTMAATGAYSYKYTPAKRGSYRVQTKTTAKVPYSSVKTTWKTFKVK